MPAAAVIPAPIAYIKVVAVKKLVVGYLVGVIGPALCVGTCIISGHPWEKPVWHYLLDGTISSFTVKKLECLKQA